MKKDTAKQIRWLTNLDDARLVKESAEAMYALSRRKDAAKYEGIQKLYLEMMIRAGHATVERHCVPTVQRPFCFDDYGTFWDGEKFSQFDAATAEPVLRDIYVVDCGAGLRFKLDAVSRDVAERAITGTPEGLVSVSQTSPDCRLTIAAQAKCVQLSVLRLHDQLDRSAKARKDTED